MAGFQGSLHPRTRTALEQVRSERGKAIVLLNRRGWSSFLSCRGCGRVWRCGDCDVSLVLHREAGRLSCHHCGRGQRTPERCPECDSVSLARHGTGTERLERELEAVLDPLPVFRLDADTGSARGGADDILAGFDAAAAGVLLGTQMVAKGHDFPAVTLGVVLDADATLRFPDFRAEERTFALVAQLAGRSGRGPAGGRVLVQALDPSAPALRHAARHDAAGFLGGELARREQLDYPPFASLIRIVCSAREPGPEAAAAGAVRSALERLERDRDQVLGPAPLFRRRGRERAQVLVKSHRRGAAIRAVRAAVDAAASARENRGVSFSVDVDPQ
jgi:primosomal protein N' (replication factor Y)